jgi:hypothetical protein
MYTVRYVNTQRRICGAKGIRKENKMQGFMCRDNNKSDI